MSVDGTDGQRRDVRLDLGRPGQLGDDGVAFPTSPGRADLDEVVVEQQLNAAWRVARQGAPRVGRSPTLRVAGCITLRHTQVMAKAISVRLDEEAERALNALEATGLTQSDAIRSSLLASATRLRRGRELAAEAAALEADETDRAEMLEVASLMESLRAPR